MGNKNLEPLKKLDKRLISDITINNNLRKNLYSIDGYKFLIYYGYKDFNLILLKACILGSNDLALYAISKGATKYDDALEGACKGGHLELVKLMIKYGANLKDNNKMGINLFLSALHGHIHIIDYILDLLKRNSTHFEMLNYHHNISASLYSNFNIKIFDYLVQLGYHDISDVLYCYACIKNSLELFRSLPILNFNTVPNKCKYYACKYGSYDIVCYLMSLGVEIDDGCIEYAFLSGNIKLITMFIDISEDNLLNIVSKIIKLGFTDTLKIILLLKNDLDIDVNTPYTWTNYYICRKKKLTDDSFENLRRIQKFKNLKYL